MCWFGNLESFSFAAQNSEGGQQTHSKAREGFFVSYMTETLFPISDEWIKKAKERRLFDDTFAPFRYFTTVTKKENGDFVAPWISWFPERGILKRFHIEPEEIIDPLIVGDGFAPEIHNRLNAIEKEQYEKRIKSLSLAQLRKQRSLWRALDEKSPLMSPNGMVRLDYPPLLVLPEEIRERIEESAEQEEKLIANENSPAVKITLLQKCKAECERRELPKEKTITREIKYEIAGAIELEGLGAMETFHSGDHAYHRISKMLSELGYSRKSASKYH